MNRGTGIVVSAPSGGGKTTLCRALARELDRLHFSVSYTTRSPRAHEVDGRDYHFIDSQTYAKMRDANAFLEFADVHGASYATGRAETEEKLAAGYDVLFDIDVQGGLQIDRALADVLLIFVVPPNEKVLEERLRRRKSESEENILLRLRNARSEVERASFYRHWIVNDDLDRALSDFSAVVRGERIRRAGPDVRGSYLGLTPGR